jgi:hypothetical protein
VRWLEFQQRLPSQNEISYWWRRWPEANIIAITGWLSGIVAVDLDPRHGGDEAWAAWAKRYAMPATPTSLTGGGGQHLLYKHPGVEVRNRTNMLSPGTTPNAKGDRVAIESGVDFRGDGGYIIVPPSLHPSGRVYAWDVEAHPDDVPIAAMPSALLDLVQRGGVEGIRKDELDIDGYVAGTTKIGEGERNTTVARLCGYFARSVDDEATLNGVMAALNESACDPALEDRELRRIVGSIWRREVAQRKAKAAIEHEGEDVDLSTLAPLEAGAALWRTLGVPVVTDWFVLMGQRPEYVLVTPEDELHFPSLLDYDRLRDQLLTRTGALPPVLKRGAFDQRARMLRACAREVVVETRHMDDLVGDWVAAYALRAGAREVPEDQQMEALQSGPVFADGFMYVRAHRFALFVEATFGERLEPRDIRRLLTAAGWHEYRALRAMRKEWE